MSSKNIQFDTLNVHGSLDNNASNDVAAFFIRNSSGVTIKNSEFQQLWHGIGSLDSDHLTFTGNKFHDLREDGIRGGGNSFVEISRNTFTDFKPNMAAGDHPDAIQFWTVNTKTPAHDINITENVISRGVGGSFQGIFLKDEVGTLHYQHVNIANNLLIGAAWNGVTVQGGTDLTITGNILSSYSDQDSRVRIEDSSKVVIANNDVGGLINDRNVDSTLTNNHIIGVAGDGGRAILTKWAAEHPSTAANLVHISSDLSLITAPLVVVAIAAQPVAAVTTIVSTSGGRLDAGGGNDTLTGNVGADKFYAGGGNDSVSGGAGTDSLYGEAGNDTLFGGDGNDLLYGGIGADVMRGGSGADSFVFRNEDFTDGLAKSTDKIVDFSAAQGDKIHLVSVDANTKTVADEGFSFIGTNQFHRVAGELRYEVSGGNASVFGDTNGDGVADFRIDFTGVTSLKASDFFL